MYKITRITNNCNMSNILLKKTKDVIFIIMGSLIMAFAVSQFLLPNQLSTGGFSGIATIVYYLLGIRNGDHNTYFKYSFIFNCIF